MSLRPAPNPATCQQESEDAGQQQRSTGTHASADDAEGEPHGAAALDKLRDLMPVDVVGVNLGQQPGDAEPSELCHTPFMDEQVVVTDALVTQGHGKVVN